jgi:hypothetical protein
LVREKQPIWRIHVHVAVYAFGNARVLYLDCNLRSKLDGDCAWANERSSKRPSARCPLAGDTNAYLPAVRHNGAMHLADGRRGDGPLLKLPELAAPISAKLVRDSPL